MSTVSSADRTLISNARRVTVETAFNLAPLTEFATATISAAPTAYPATGLNVTGTSADWLDAIPGMLYSLERPDGTIIAYGTLRLPPVPSAAYIDPKSRGDGGFARDIHYEIEGGETMRVYDCFPPWGAFSRATAEQIFKYWNVGYRGQGSRPDPVVNLGTHQQAYIDALTGEATFSLSASASYDWFGGAGNIVSYAWELPAALTVISGATSSADLSVTAPPGVYRVACTITTVTGRPATGYRYLFANTRDDDGAGAAFGAVYAVSLPSADQQDATGREITVRAIGAARAAVYPGAMCVFTSRVYYDGQELESGATTFVGYLTEVQSEGSLDQQNITLKFSSPLRYGRNITTYTQLMEEVPIPTDWTQVSFGLSQPAYYGFYALRYHTFLLLMHDYLYDAKLATLRRRVIGLSQTNLAGQLEFIGQIGRAMIGCRSDGTFTARMIGDLLENDERNALDEKYTWTADDLVAPLEVAPDIRPKVSQIIMDAISYDGTDIATYRAIAPGYAAGQGQGIDDAPDVIVTPAEGQERLERIAGHQYAYDNNPLGSLNLKAAYPLDILEPADNDWHILNVSTDYLAFSPNQFGVGWKATTRFTPNSVNREWEQIGRVTTLKITAEARLTSFGQKGEFLPVAKEEGWAWQSPSGWLDGQGTANRYMQDTPEFGLGDDYALAAAWDSNGNPAYSETFLSERVTWSSARGTGADRLPDGNVLDMVWNYAIPGAGCYALLQTAEDELSVYRTTDVRSGNWIPETTLTIDPNAYTGKARIACSSSLVAVAYLTSTGINVKRKAGSWGGVVQVGSAFSDPDAIQSELALSVDGNDIHVGGLVANGFWALHKATGAAGAFAPVANRPADSQRAPGTIAHRSALNGDRYVSLYRSSSAAAVENIVGFPVQNEYLNFPLDSADAPDTLTRYGFHARRQTAELSTGTLYTVGSLQASFKTTLWYTPGAASPPDYYPPNSSFYDVPVTLEVALIGAENQPLWSSGIIQWSSADLGGTVTYAPSPVGFSRVRYEIEQAINETFTTPIEGVANIEYRFTSDGQHNFNAGEFLDDGSLYSFFEMTGGVTALGITEKAFEGWRLWQVNSSNVWADVTPPDVIVPQRRNAIGRALSASNLTIIGVDSTGKRRVNRTINAGAAWTDKGQTTYKWVKELASGVFILGGQGRIDLTVDDLDTTHQRIGDWSRSIGVVGDIEGVLLLVEN